MKHVTSNHLSFHIREFQTKSPVVLDTSIAYDSMLFHHCVSLRQSNHLCHLKLKRTNMKTLWRRFAQSSIVSFSLFFCRSLTSSTGRSWSHSRSWLKNSQPRTDKQQHDAYFNGLLVFCTDAHPTLAVCMQYILYFHGEMFLIMPGSRQGLDRFKAPGLMQSGMTHLIDQTYSLTDRVDEFWRPPPPTPPPVISQGRQ